MNIHLLLNKNLHILMRLHFHYMPNIYHYQPIFILFYIFVSSLNSHLPTCFTSSINAGVSIDGAPSGRSPPHFGIVSTITLYLAWAEDINVRSEYRIPPPLFPALKCIASCNRTIKPQKQANPLSLVGLLEPIQINELTISINHIV